MYTRRKLLSLAGTAAASGAVSKPPNIILIMADDMGFSDIGCYGSEIATPNLDRLAKGGLRFTQFYNGARCCPTRAALLTGLYAHQAGVGHMVENRGVPSYQGYLNDRCVTLGEAMREGGYTTLMTGKWHVGEKQPHWPKDRGFDRYFGLVSGSSSFFRVTEDRPLVDEDKVLRPKDDSFYLTDLFTDHAVNFLDEHGRGPKPFFLYTAYTSPHWPLHARPEDIAKYRGKYKIGWDELRKRRHAKMTQLGIVDKRWPVTARDADVPAWDDVKDKDNQDLLMAVYAAQIDRMDQNIGRLLAKVKALGQESNTLVLFLADNGGCAEEIDRGKPGAGRWPGLFLELWPALGQCEQHSLPPLQALGARRWHRHAVDRPLARRPKRRREDHPSTRSLDRHHGDVSRCSRSALPGYLSGPPRDAARRPQPVAGFAGQATRGAPSLMLGTRRQPRRAAGRLEAGGEVARAVGTLQSRQGSHGNEGLGGVDSSESEGADGNLRRLGSALRRGAV